MSFFTLDLLWKSVAGLTEEENKKLSFLVDSVCSSWDRTPWREGQICKGVGAYCAALPIAILDELYGVEEEIPKLAYVKRKHVQRSAKLMLTRYKEYADVNKIEPGEGIEPGDILVVGEASPNHVYIAGGFQSHLWHADRTPGVCRTGLGFYSSLLRVYRTTNKRSWLLNK